MKILRGEHGPIKVVPGNVVVCISTEHEEYYYPGEIFAVVKNGHTTLQKQHSDGRNYGGHYGVWQRYYQNEGIEDLL